MSKFIKNIQIFVVNPKFLSLILIIVIILLSLPPRLWNLRLYPPIVVDEPAYLRDINKLLPLSGFYPVNFQWDWSQATLVYYPTVFLIKTFGISDQILALRLVSVVFSLAGLIPFFLIVKRYTNPVIAFTSTLLFSFSYYYLQFSRVGWGVIYATAFGLYIIWALENALESKSKIWFIIAGLASGLTMYTYRGGQVYVIAAFLFVLIEVYLLKIKFIKKLYLFLFFILPFFIVSSPWLFKIYTNWDYYNLRLKVVSVSNANIPYHNLYDTGSIWKYQILTSIKSWVLLDSIDGGNIENKRYLPLKDSPVNPFIKATFWIGLLLAIFNFRKKWIWLKILVISLILGQILTIDPPNGARGLVNLPVIYIFSSLAFYYFYLLSKKNFFVLLIIITLSILFMYYDLNYYKYWMGWIQL